jgi:hypothetical protein
MKSQKKILFAMFGIFFLISGCQNEDQKDDYTGVSDLISERNKIRYQKSEKPLKRIVTPKKITTNDTNAIKPESISKEEELSSIVLYEQDVEIVNSKSNQVLAKGVAYINKKGQIVKIKIVKK